MKTYVLLILVVNLLFSSCRSSYRTLKPELEKDFRLSNYPTFGFYAIDVSGDTSSKTFENRIGIIKDAIARNLQERGLNEAQDPALKINIALTVKEEVQTRETDFRTEGLPRYMGQRRYSWKSEEVVVGRYKEGTMLIDLVDLANNKLVWRGGSEGIVPDKTNNFTTRINQAVDDLFEKIPK